MATNFGRTKTSAGEKSWLMWWTGKEPAGLWDLCAGYLSSEILTAGFLGEFLLTKAWARQLFPYKLLCAWITLPSPPCGWLILATQLIAPLVPCDRCGTAAPLESRSDWCQCWHRPSHYIRKGCVPLPWCPSPPGWPQLAVGRRVEWRAPREAAAGRSKLWLLQSRKLGDSWMGLMLLHGCGKGKVSAGGFAMLLLEEEGNTSQKC